MFASPAKSREATANRDRPPVSRLARERRDRPLQRSILNSTANETNKIQYGFKRISQANLLQRDDHPSYPSRLRGDKWVRACLKPQLEPNVPEEIAFLFEVARGSMVYGMFFLPLASLATEQGFRVLEAGPRHRCEQLGLLQKKSGKTKVLPGTSFADLIAALEQDGKIPDGDLVAWKSMVFLRNRFSHHTSQTIRSRQHAIEQLAYIAELLNRLFK